MNGKMSGRLLASVLGSVLACTVASGPPTAAAGASEPEEVTSQNVVVKSMTFSPATRVESPKRITPTTLTMGVSHPASADLSEALDSTWITATKGRDVTTSNFWPDDASYRRVSPTYTVIRVRLKEGLCGQHEGGSCYPKGTYKVTEVQLGYAEECAANPGAGCVGRVVVSSIPTVRYKHAWATKTRVTTVKRRKGKLVVSGHAARTRYSDRTDASGDVIGGHWRGWKKAKLSVWFDPKGAAPARRVKGVSVKRGGQFTLKVPVRKSGRYQVRQASQGTYYQSASRTF